MKKEKDIEIKRTKQPDKVSYESSQISIRQADYIDGIVISPRHFWEEQEWFLDIDQAKELSKVLPKFLEEMEK